METNCRKRCRKSKLLVRDCLDSDDENIAVMQEQIEATLSKIKNKSVLKKINNETALKPLEFSVKVEVEELNESIEDIDIQIDSVGSLYNLSVTPDSISRQEPDIAPNYVLTEELIKNEFFKLSKTTTSIPDKLIEASIRNYLGREADNIDLNETEEAIQNLLRRKWKNWHNTFPKIRDTPLMYKCYVCKIAWWHFYDFREHVLKHKNKLNFEIETNCHECNIIAYQGPTKETKDIWIYSNCWKCGKDMTPHMMTNKTGYRCSACMEKFYTCTQLSEHEGSCAVYKKILKASGLNTDQTFSCNLCPVKHWSQDKLDEHMVVRHSVRSDEPTEWFMRKCPKCDQYFYFLPNHSCRYKPVICSCEFCSLKFKTNFLLMIHLNLTTELFQCRVCGKMLRRQCMELKHLMEHTDNYTILYKCILCSHSLFFPDLVSAKRHKAISHPNDLQKKTILCFFDMVVVPKHLIDDKPLIKSIDIATENKAPSDWCVSELPVSNCKGKNKKEKVIPKKSEESEVSNKKIIDGKKEKEDLQRAKRFLDITDIKDKKIEGNINVININKPVPIVYINRKKIISFNKIEGYVKEKLHTNNKEIKNHISDGKAAGSFGKENNEINIIKLKSVDSIKKENEIDDIFWESDKEKSNMKNCVEIDINTLSIPLQNTSMNKSFISEAGNDKHEIIIDKEQTLLDFSVQVKTEKPDDFETIDNVIDNQSHVSHDKNVEIFLNIKEEPVETQESDTDIDNVNADNVINKNINENCNDRNKINDKEINDCVESTVEIIDNDYPNEESYEEVAFNIKEEVDSLDELSENDLIILHPSNSISMNSLEVLTDAEPGSSNAIYQSDDGSEDKQTRHQAAEIYSNQRYGKRVYKCRKCSFEGVHQEYRNHIKNANHKKALPVCQRKYKKIRPFYIFGQMDDDFFKCTKCNMSYSTFTEYIKHFKKMHDYQDPMTCPVCKRRFTCFQTYRSHIHSHMRSSFITIRLIKTKDNENDVKFQCKTCSVLVKATEFFVHWESHLEITQEAVSVNQVLADMEDKKELKEMIVLLQGSAVSASLPEDWHRFCLLCDKTFNRKHDCRRHFIEHLLVDAYKEREKYGFLKCQICGQDFQIGDEYKRHMREHAALPLYKCEICDKTFSDSSNFSKHKKVHNLSVVICDICRKKFNSKLFLAKHLKMHESIKPLVCGECDRVFYTESSYKKHMKKSRSNFRCPSCNIVFETVKSKWEHLWEKHKVRRHRADCPICKKSFRKHYDVKQHIRLDHNDKLFKYIPDKEVLTDGLKRKRTRPCNDLVLSCG